MRSALTGPAPRRTRSRSLRGAAARHGRCSRSALSASGTWWSSPTAATPTTRRAPRSRTGAGRPAPTASGGVGPGGIGNYLVTGHRTSSTRAFERLPELRRGARVVVTTAQVRYVYRVVDTRRTSFRSPASLRAQRAPVPGRPGVTPTQAMITLSTCATQEDHAVGNYWSDRLGNPEHRIEKIGVLVSWSPRLELHEPPEDLLGEVRRLRDQDRDRDGCLPGEHLQHRGVGPVGAAAGVPDHERAVVEGHDHGAEGVGPQVRLVLRVGLHLVDEGGVDDVAAVQQVAPPGELGASPARPPPPPVNEAPAREGRNGPAASTRV